MEVSPSAYYAWCLATEAGGNTREDQVLADKVRNIFVENKCSFGSRRLSDRLKKQGIAVGRFKTRRIMRDLGLQVRYPKRIKVTTDSNHNEAISPNRLDRQFQAAKPNEVWTTDITYGAPILRRYLLLILTKLEHVWNAFWPSEALMNRMPAFCYEKA
jgi:putative transposase